MRFGARSEAFSGAERDLFQEVLASDIAAAEATLAQEQQDKPAPISDPKPPRPRAGRQHLAVAPRPNIGSPFNSEHG
jgi:hypothetical protein